MALKYQFYNSGDDNARGIGSASWQAQSFTTNQEYTITSVKLKLYKSGSPGTITVSIQGADSNGSPDGSDVTNATGTYDGNTLGASPGAFVEITFTGGSLSANTKYNIVVRAAGSAGTLLWRVDASTPTYTDGNTADSSNSGSTWNTDTARDCMFETYGALTGLDKIYTKKLVSIGNHEMWYESPAGTMIELSDATSEIDTTQSLTAVEAFQKIFIANGTALKVADFANTKLVTTDAGAVATTKGLVLTGGTSGAEMVVDYADGVTDDSAANIYGIRTTIATFSSGETVTGTGSVSFAIAEAETAPPHFYDWTAYGNDTTTYGSMPTNANIIALYRGRLVLSGDKNYPHQWYMSKIAAPFDWVYSATDPLTAVAGNNVDAGEMGDVIRALIPNGDDFLIFGCAGSMWILRGDPAEGGSIDKLDDVTGIYGSRAWCQDGLGNTYFFGSKGLYVIDQGGSQPRILSERALPKWIETWALDPALHRVVLTYDPIRDGVIISKTTMSDGTNLNYFYHVGLEAFFPETYPNACGIFHSYWYESDAAATRELVLASNDGYLRYFKDSAKSDDSGASDTAISSYMALGPLKLDQRDDFEGIAKDFRFELGGGASGGAYTDSDGISYEFHRADDAETVAEDIKDGATALWSGTVTGTGRQGKTSDRVRGIWLGAKIYNSTAAESWSLNNLKFNIKPVGRR